MHRFGFGGIFAGAGYVLSTGDSRNGSGISTGQSAPVSQATLETLTYLASSLVSDLPVPKRQKIVRCTPTSGGSRPDSRSYWFRWLVRFRVPFLQQRRRRTRFVRRRLRRVRTPIGRPGGKTERQFPSTLTLEYLNGHVILHLSSACVVERPLQFTPHSSLRTPSGAIGIDVELS